MYDQMGLVSLDKYEKYGILRQQPSKAKNIYLCNVEMIKRSYSIFVLFWKLCYQTEKSRNSNVRSNGTRISG